ncbi:MAG TPA: M56 family metallopeptidase [Candidatus Eremiobacteraceae bacterium]
MITQAVGALFNACWQGLAIVAVTSLALRFFQRSSAATRYAVWFAALAVVAVLPAVDFGIARIAPAASAVSAQPAQFKIIRTGEVSYSYAKPPAADRAKSVQPPTTTIGFAVEQAPDPAMRLQALAATVLGRTGAMLSAVATPIFLTWLFFSALMLYRLALAYARLRRVKRELAPLDDAGVDRLIAHSRRPVVVGIATDLTMPCVLGFAKPAIALPATLAAELSHEDLERIVRHEHAHVRRWDDVANALQLIVQAVMCLNPAVHLISRSLNVEREIACDDFAVEPLAERVQYAKCLTHIAIKGFGRARALPAPGFFFNRKQLLVRVERLLERGHNGSTTIAAAARYALAGLALVAIAVARVQLPVIAATTGPATAAPATVSVPAKPAAPTNIVVPTASVGQTASVGPTFMVGHVHPHPHAHVMLASRTAAAVRAATHFATAARTISDTVAAAVTRATTIAPAYAFGRARIAAHVIATTRARVAASVASTFMASHGIAFAPAIDAPHDSNVAGADYLDALAAAGYRNLSVDDLVRMKNVGVDGGLIAAAVRYSGSRPAVEMLVRMASVGVDADYLSHLQSSGYPRMGLEDVVRMRSLGVDPNYIRDMTAVLHTKPSIEQLMQLRALGVDADYVRSFAQVGYDKLTPENLMRLRAVGVDADYVRMLRSKGIGGSGLSVDDLIRMKSAGVE